jgi:hypothetical protein
MPLNELVLFEPRGQWVQLNMKECFRQFPTLNINNGYKKGVSDDHDAHPPIRVTHEVLMGMHSYARINRIRN